MTVCSRLLLAVSAMFLASSSSAMLVAPPKIVVVASPDGGSLLRIDPGPWHSTDPAQHATASVFRYDPISKSYRLSTTFALRNRVAPDLAIIANDATYIATCDDWNEIGCTPNAVVVYRGSGEFLKAWSLEDIFSPAEIRRFGPFAINDSSRLWRGNFITFVTDGKGPMLSIPWRMDSPWQVLLRLDLNSLTITRSLEQWVDLQTHTIVPAPKE
jgi:hypothetical protein